MVVVSVLLPRFLRSPGMGDYTDISVLLILNTSIWLSDIVTFDHNVVACAVLSGNRNFESRIHPAVRAAYLASPPLVVAFALRQLI